MTSASSMEKQLSLSTGSVAAHARFKRINIREIRTRNTASVHTFTRARP